MKKYLPELRRLWKIKRRKRIDFICTDTSFANISFDFWFYYLFFNKHITVYEKKKRE
jgi:hypothetical protein